MGTNSNVSNALVVQGRANEAAPWVDMAAIEVDVLSDFLGTVPVYPLPFMRAGWSSHASGTSSDVVVRVVTLTRETPL